MPTVVIENPIINAPFEEPRRHWTFDDNGITDTIAKSRGPSASINGGETPLQGTEFN